jgi:thymidylate synthase ThyX
MTFTDTARPDYITPRLIAANPQASAVYDEAMREAWDAKNRLLALGVPLKHALYVLPNAKTLRFVESGSLLSLLHKWTLRTCFNAQEEIFLVSMDEVAQVRAVHPRIGRHIGPPCVVRNGLISPRCTEGTHFCGVPCGATSRPSCGGCDSRVEAEPRRQCGGPTAVVKIRRRSCADDVVWSRALRAHRS